MPYKDPQKAKENAAKRQKTYLERHPEANRAAARAWYNRNKERAKAAHKKWVEKNREKLKAYRATRKAQEKAYAEKNHERILEYRRQWRARRKALKEGLALPEPAKEQEVAVADFSKCRLCNAAGTVRFRKATANKPSGYNCGCSNPQCRAFLGSIGDVPKLHATMKEATDAWELFASGKAELLGTVFEWMEDEEDRQEREEEAKATEAAPVADTPAPPKEEAPEEPETENPEEPGEDIFKDVEPDILEGSESGEEEGQDETPEAGEEEGMRDYEDADMDPEDAAEGGEYGEEFPDETEEGDEEPVEGEDGGGEEEEDGEEDEETDPSVRIICEVDGIQYVLKTDAEGCDGCAFCLPFGRRQLCAASADEELTAARTICDNVGGVWEKAEEEE